MFINLLNTITCVRQLELSFRAYWPDVLPATNTSKHVGEMCFDSSGIKMGRLKLNRVRDNIDLIWFWNRWILWVLDDRRRANIVMSHMSTTTTNPKCGTPKKCRPNRSSIWPNLPLCGYESSLGFESSEPQCVDVSLFESHGAKHRQAELCLRYS